MERMTLIPANKPYPCTRCYTAARIKFPITTDDFPIAIKCPSCHTIIVINTNPLIPKVDPSKIPAGLFWRVIKGLTEEQAEDPARIFDPNFSELKEEEVMQINESHEHLPYSVTTNKLGEHINSMFEQVDVILKDLTAFRFQMGNYFLTKWREALKFKKFWREEYLQDFLEWPIISFPAECDEVHCKRHARWIMAPRFFAPKFGVQIPVAGGFGLQFCNQFTRLSFPLETEEATTLQVAQPLDLKVVGNKIIGPSLPFCWKKIPGIQDDVDATSHNISVYINNNEQARPWLANQGVVAWEDNPISEEKIAYKVVPDIMQESKEFAQDWPVFKKTGRVGLFHHSLQASRETAMMLALMVRGFKCFLVNSIEDTYFYKRVRNNISSAINDKTSSQSSCVYMENGEDFILDNLQKAAVCVIDFNHGGIDDALITKMFDYRGLVIIVSTDPIMDYTKENITCPRVYGLAGTPCYDTELFPVETANSVYAMTKQSKNSYVSLIQSLKDKVNGETYEEIKNMIFKQF